MTWRVSGHHTFEGIACSVKSHFRRDHHTFEGISSEKPRITLLQATLWKEERCQPAREHCRGSMAKRGELCQSPRDGHHPPCWPSIRPVLVRRSSRQNCLPAPGQASNEAGVVIVRLYFQRAVQRAPAFSGRHAAGALSPSLPVLKLDLLPT